MLLDTTPPPLLGQLVRKPPPLWYVTNGDVTVGPVTTNLLLRGVLHERVPDDCMVRERTWRSFRKLERIREVAALKRAQARQEAIEIEPTRWEEPAPVAAAHAEFSTFLLGAEDRDDLFDRCLAETMKASGALVGAVHRRMPPYGGFVTTSVSGPGMRKRLDRAFPADEATFLYAAQGRAICESPGASSASDRVSERLGYLASCSGVAMVPVLCAGRLYAVVELGRPDHRFRLADVREVATIVGLVADRIETVKNPVSA